MISGINHLTFAVSNLDRSLRFYCDVLGCNAVHVWRGGAYLEAGSAWICLSVDSSAAGGIDYTHTAFTVAPDAFCLLAEKIIQSGAQIWQKNRSEGDSLYFCCPDAHRLELHVGDLNSRLRGIGELERRHCDAAR